MLDPNTAQRDPSGIIFALIMVAVAAAIFFAVTRLRKRNQPPANVAAQREEQARLKKLVDAGTHVALPGGGAALKCMYCDAVATMRPFAWVSDSGVVDLVRRWFGAPAKVRVCHSTWDEPSHCALCDPLAFEEFRIENAEYEVDRAKLESEWETRRARFQRVGVHERVRARIAKHELEIGGRRRGRKSEATAKVLPFGSSQRTGTEGK